MSRTDQSYYFFVGSLGKGKNDFVAESAVIEVIALRTFGSYVTSPSSAKSVERDRKETSTTRSVLRNC